MATAHQRDLTIHGGTGGDGGQGIEQGKGGTGGAGYGPNVNAGPGTMHVHYHGGAENQDIIINWLSPINFFQRQADISQMREKGTGGWLLAHPLFKKWEADFGSTLWCHGIPGAGKTVLVSMVVDHLSTAFRNNEDIGVACIYLNHKEADQKPPAKLLAGLWRQLVVDRDIGSSAECLYKQHCKKGTAPSLEEVVNVLSSSLKEFSQVFIVVDGMDEYPEVQRGILLPQLAALGSNVHLMITSRPHIFPETFSFPNLETLDIQAAPEDIQAYINTQIKLSPCLSRHIKRKPVLQEEILTKILDTVDGMFLLAKLHVESLSTKNTIGDVREAFKKLPMNLYDSYDIAMQRIEAQNEDNRKTACSTLTWVVNAKRPLTVSELTVALAIKPGAQRLDEDFLLDIETILAVCAGLVIVDKESLVIRLVHYTTQEYFDKIQVQKFPDAQTEITRTLLTYLAFDEFPDPSLGLCSDSTSNLSSDSTSYLASDISSNSIPPLHRYCQYCLAHAAGQPEGELRTILMEFLGQAFQWRKTMNPGSNWHYKWDSPPWDYPDWPSQPSSLWIAAAANLVDTTNFLLEGTPSLQHSNCSEIFGASYYGHTEIVSMLLKKGANINAAEEYHGSPLQAAAIQGHTETVTFLLKNGADANAAEGEFGSTLGIAAAEGLKEIVEILLINGADINAAEGEYGSPLQAAAVEGHAEIVHILLKNGADVNAAGGFYGSPLQAAPAQGETEIVDILLKNSADVNVVGRQHIFLKNDAKSTLGIAAARGHKEIVDILLKNGANVNVAGGEYESPLQAAAAHGHTEIVDILLKNGADINVAGGEYGSPLQAAAAGGHTDIVCILLQNGPDIIAAGE
ncbi:ankyrin repeat-containing domain protein [Mycena galopus ATCC 62051]|nr:ankyrin repeat-containing domain protein [Mycena galopus ATCC 62051]